MVNSNNRRASEANSALEAYLLEAEGTDLHFVEPVTDEIAFVYLLAGLRHLCDAQGWDFAAFDKQAYRAYTEDLFGNPAANADFTELAEESAKGLYNVVVEDTITYRRRVCRTIEATDCDEAKSLAYVNAATWIGSGEGVEEEQIDNTPYAVVSCHTRRSNPNG